MYLTKTKKILGASLGTSVIGPSSYGIYMLSKTSSPSKKIRTVKDISIDKEGYGKNSYVRKLLDLAEKFSNEDEGFSKQNIIFLKPEKENKELWDQLWQKVKTSLDFEANSEQAKLMESINSSFDETNSKSSLSGKCSEWYSSEDNYEQKNLRDDFGVYFCSFSASEIADSIPQD